MLLIKEFQDPRNRGKDNTDTRRGLEQIHIRRALEEGFTYSKNKNYKNKQNQVETFFGDRLETFYREKNVKPCIKKNTNKGGMTGMYLQRLCSKEFDVVSVVDKKASALRYVINDNSVIGMLDKQFINLRVERFAVETIVAMQKDESFPLQSKETGEIYETWGCMLGLPEGFYELCDEEERSLVIAAGREVLACVATVAELINKKKKGKTKDDFAVFAMSGV